MATFDIDTDQGVFVYETDPCKLTGPDGNAVPLTRLSMPYLEPAVSGGPGVDFSPSKPLVGKEQPRVLKIQLGLGCNYSCSYCSQGGQKAENTGTRDALDFVDGLDEWLHEAPEKIEFWGGEPMLYWHKIQALAPGLRERFPSARMSIVTNGSLLTMDRALWLHDMGFSMAISHDGPGQALRGEDPFEDSLWLDLVRQVFRLFGRERFSFNVVITPLNFRLAETYLWFEQRLGFEVPVNIEDVVTDYGGAKWTPQLLAEMADEVNKAARSGLALAFPRMRWSVLQWLQCIAIAKPLDGSHQVCSMDQKDHLAVDLSGNVLTCQNAGAQSGHVIGVLPDLVGVKLDTAQSWASRPNCRSCPVVHLCYGSCMFLDGVEFESSCETSFHYNRAILFGALHLLTGATARSMSGWQPARRKPFPISVVAG